eukprot:CAMPEP_0115843872 /NCGR_PEP_ID=MMETSP0287-20121206/8539_1 /TAXON_ID=412157 /ORGANISM="Chrysochromulina rotalis, Strain UIO044" /LENGTH=39 /DNA_ID= /DNA_START= /DNA_END= /DNA_ORIENTATION=
MGSHADGTLRSSGPHSDGPGESSRGAHAEGSSADSHADG